MRTLKLLACLALILSGLSAAGATMKLKLRVTETDSPTRKADTKFRLALTSGYSVVDRGSNYYFFGGTHQRRAWMSCGTDMWDHQLHGKRCDVPAVGSCTVDPGDCRPEDTTIDRENRCAPWLDPRERDPLCGDSTGMWWISKNTSNGWWSYNRSTGGTGVIRPFPYFGPPSAAEGEWPVRWPESYPTTGIRDFQQTLDFAKINARIPSPPLPASTGCTWGGRLDGSQLWNPDHLATGATNSKAVYHNGVWYMAFNASINNPNVFGSGADQVGWSAADNLRVLWARSTDGQHWDIENKVLFRSRMEDSACGLGLLATQLFIDNNHFYLVANDLYSGIVTLLRAPIDLGNPYGYGQWQLATAVPNSQSIAWTNVPDGPLTLQGPGSLNPAILMPGPVGGVKQTAIRRVYAPGTDDSRYIGVVVATEDRQPGVTREVLELWSTPNLDTLFTKEQEEIDLGYVKQPDHPLFDPKGLNGYEVAFTSTSERAYSNELDLWLIGNFNGPDDHTSDLTAYRMTATLSGGIFSPRAALRSHGHFYVTAEGSGGGAVTASRTRRAGWESFTIIDRNGGALQTGDAVNIQAPNGLYVTALGGGGGGVVADRAGTAEWETFVIEKRNGGGPIVHGDHVAFRSHSNHYLVAEQGGDRVVRCNATVAGDWETFTFLTPPAPVAGDLDDDGRADVVWRDGASYPVWLMKNDLHGSRGFVAAPAGGEVAGSGDFDGDGQMDLLWRLAGGSHEIWFLRGMEVVAKTALSSQPNTGSELAAAGDFNGDGRTDLLWRNVSQNTVWLMNGASLVAQGAIAESHAGWKVAATGDFSGDGQDDLFWRNDAGENAVWLMNGTAIASAALVVSVPQASWKIAMTGDYDGDGKHDLFWREESSGVNAIWFMNGTTLASAVYTQGDANLARRVVAGGDYDADGKSDLLWHDAGTRDTYIWLMNGSAVASTHEASLMQQGTVAAPTPTGAK